MTSPQQQLSRTAYEQARTGIISTVSSNLRSRRALLMAGGYISSPPEPNWDDLALEAITQRSIAGVPLSQFPPLDDGRTIEQLIPSAQRVNAIAQEVATGVAENTGSIPFLRGATIGQAFSGFFTMIRERGFFAAISGVFNLMFGDGTSAEARQLTGYIGNHTASAIGNGVMARLQARQAELGLSAEQVAEIGLQVQNAARVQAGLQPLVGNSISTANVQSQDGLSQNEVQSIRLQVRRQVIAGLGLQEVPQANGTVRLESANAGAAGSGGGTLARLAQVAGVASFSSEQATLLVDTMTDALQSVVLASPPPANPTEARAAIHEHLQRALASRSSKLGLGGMSESDIGHLASVMADDMTIQFYASRPRQQDRAMGEAFASDPARLHRYNQAQQALAATVIRRQFDSSTVTPMQVLLDQIARSRAVGEPPTWQPLTAAEQNVLIKSMAGVMTSEMARRSNPPATREEFVAAAMAQFESDREAMGLGQLPPEVRGQYFRQIAEAMYESRASGGSVQMPSLESQVQPVIRSALQAQMSGTTMNMLALSAGANQVSASRLVDALTTPMTTIVVQRITDRDVIVRMLRESLNRSNPPIGLPPAVIDTLAQSIADEYLHPRSGNAQAGNHRHQLNREVTTALSQMDSNTRAALSAAGYDTNRIGDQITSALERVVNTAGFSEMNGAQRHALITQQVQQQLGGGPIDRVVATYIADRLTGRRSGNTVLTVASTINTLPQNVGLGTVTDMTTNALNTINEVPTTLGLPSVTNMANTATTTLGNLSNQVIPGSGALFQRLGNWLSR